MHGSPRLHEALAGILRHPARHVVFQWNWKSAILSTAVRSLLFFVANLGAGLPAASAAFLTELALRAVTAGFCGSLTQALRHVQPAWAGQVGALVLLPIATHALEFVVHWQRGTERLAASLALSVAFTCVSSSFNLFAMRRGIFIVGRDAASIGADLRRVPRVVAEFAWEIARSVGRFVQAS